MTCTPALWFAALTLALACTASDARAQLIPVDPNARRDPLPVSIPDDQIRPVDSLPGAPRRPLFDGWLHDVTLEANIGYSGIKSKDRRRPSDTHQEDYALGASFRVLERGFGALSINHARQDTKAQNTPENFGVRVLSDGDVTGVQVTGGAFLLPFLGAGVSAAWGSGDGRFMFQQPTPHTPSESSDESYAPFIFVVAPWGNWLFALSGTLTFAEQEQEYPGNTPQRQESWTRTSTVMFDAGYRITRDLRLGGSLGWVHTIDQRKLDTESGLDQDWYVIGVNAAYEITRDFGIVLRASTWLENSNTDFDRVSLGLRYKL